MFQLLKSECWNSADFRVLQGMVARELRAELVDVWTVAGRRAWIVSNGPPDAGRVRACSYVVLHRLGSIALAGRRCNAP